MTKQRQHDCSQKGLERRYNYAVEHLTLECNTIAEEVGNRVLMAALLGVLREAARAAGYAPCEYQMFLIDELAYMNRLRRVMDEKEPEAKDE
jgi:hypothetical protein